MTEERSDVWCTNCARSFIATLDLSLNGNHQITCPLCGHVHYRVVRNGVVTGDRWASSSGPVYSGPVYFATTTTAVAVAPLFTSNSTTTVSSSWLNRSDLMTT